jgi:hypothetical protein
MSRLETKLLQKHMKILWRWPLKSDKPMTRPATASLSSCGSRALGARPHELHECEGPRNWPREPSRTSVEGKRAVAGNPIQSCDDAWGCARWTRCAPRALNFFPNTQTTNPTPGFMPRRWATWLPTLEVWRPLQNTKGLPPI